MKKIGHNYIVYLII